MTQLPVASIDAVVPDTVQTAGVMEAKATVRPELAVAVSFGFAPTGWLESVEKVMVCGTMWTIKLCETIGAAP